MAIVVLPAAAAAKAVWTMASECESRAEVASSSSLLEDTLAIGKYFLLYQDKHTKLLACAAWL